MLKEYDTKSRDAQGVEHRSAGSPTLNMTNVDENIFVTNLLSNAGESGVVLLLSRVVSLCVYTYILDTCVYTDILDTTSREVGVRSAELT